MLKNSDLRPFFDVRFYRERTFCSRFRPMPGRVSCVGYMGSGFGHMGQATIGLGGGMAASLANRLRFCTVATSRNSSLAPLRPRKRSLVSARLRFTTEQGLDLLALTRGLQIGLRLHERAGEIAGLLVDVAGDFALPGRPAPWFVSKPLVKPVGPWVVPIPPAGPPRRREGAQGPSWV